jgi:site-specific DNA recombinase
MKPVAPKILRCAIYTRVSTEHGLEQEFNSLHAQREAAQAYVKSQAHEGWKPVRDHYDDGGFSGGSMERPALQKLLADIQERRIDIVVVYKVDRLTRSLTDFARLVELFAKHGVSFVSVTQSFNTTTSMGRLTLNVLLSFAQFEREVTGERIRDKIAASKKKGIWVGGVVPLGYQLKDRKLLVDVEEAKIVRLVFERYLALGSLPALQRELKEHGVLTRKRLLSSGTVRGGVPLTNGPLVHLLRNRMYCGELNHRDKSYPGEHQPIIDRSLFDQVQAKLSDNRRGSQSRRQPSDALLLGKLFDDRGNRMTPSYAIKRGVRYRYYVSSVLAQGRKEEAGSVSRIGSGAIESVVLNALATAPQPNKQSTSSASKDERADSPRPTATIDGHPALPRADPDGDRIDGSVERITLSTHSVEIRLLAAGDIDARSSVLTIAWSPTSFIRKREIIQPTDGIGEARPIRAKARTKLLTSVALSRRWLGRIISGEATDINALALREGMSERSMRMMLSLAFLAPDIVKAAANGSLPRGFGVSRLTDLPSDWTEQRRAVGLAPAP